MNKDEITKLLRSMKVLILIDYIYDFISDDGVLTTRKAEQNIENSIVLLVDSFIENNHFVVFTVDEIDPTVQYPPEINSLLHT